MSNGCTHRNQIKDVLAPHFHSSHHPIVRSFEPGEDWSWCYVDEVEVD